MDSAEEACQIGPLRRHLLLILLPGFLRRSSPFTHSHIFVSSGKGRGRRGAYALARVSEVLEPGPRLPNATTAGCVDH